MVGRKFIFVFVLSIVPCLAHAHHGKDFLLTSTSKTPHAGTLFGIVSADFSRNSSHLGIEPGLVYGITDRWSAELHLHFDGLNESPNLESVGLEQRLLLYDATGRGREPYAAFPFDVGALVEFEKAIGHHNDTGGHDEAELRVILSRSWPDFGFAFNIGGAFSFGNEAPLYRYGLGARHRIASLLYGGIEITGNVLHLRNMAITPALYLEINDRLYLRFGSSIDLSPTRSDVVYRGSLLLGL